MATLDPHGLFQTWIFSGREELQSQLLTGLNKQMIQNLISQAAAEKVSLTFDPSNPSQFIQIEAELHGRIKTLQTLLDNSAQAESELDPGLRQIEIPS